MLNCAGAAWEPVFVDYFNGETRQPEWRAAVNEMGEAPVLEHAGLKIVQSGVILDYLAEALGRFGPTDAAERREILSWVLFDNHKFTSYFATHRFMNALAPQAPDPGLLSFLRARTEAAFAIVEGHLVSRAFMVGGRPTLADFSLAGYVFYPEEETGFDLPAHYPHIAAWTERLKTLPGWAAPYDLMPGQKFLAERR